MTGLLDIYITQLKTWLVLHLQYRVALIIWMIELILQPVIYLAVWSTVARSSGGTVGGFSAGDFAAYYIVFMIVSHAILNWHMWEYDYNIRQGILSAKLLRPVHPIHEDVAQNLTYKLLMLVILVPAAVILSLLFQPALNPPVWAAFAFVPALVMAGIISFLAGWVLAMAAFWTTRVHAINQLYFVAMIFFSGQIAPLALLPQPAQAIAAALPFRWMASFPVELLLGRLTSEAGLTGMLTQIIWIALLLLLLRVVWHAAVRRYSAVGA